MSSKCRCQPTPPQTSEGKPMRTIVLNKPLGFQNRLSFKIRGGAFTHSLLFPPVPTKDVQDHRVLNLQNKYLQCILMVIESHRTDQRRQVQEINKDIKI